MIYRNFRQVSTRQWLDVLNTFEKEDPQNVKAETHRDQLAAGWGLAPADVIVVDGPTDARTGILIQGPVPVPPLDSASAIAAAVSAAADALVEHKAFAALAATEKADLKSRVVTLVSKAQGR